MLNSLKEIKQKDFHQIEGLEDLGSEDAIIDSIGDYLGELPQEELEDKKNTNLQYLQALYESANLVKTQAELLDTKRLLFNEQIRGISLQEYLEKLKIGNQIYEKAFDLQLSLNYGKINELEVYKEYKEILELYTQLIH